MDILVKVSNNLYFDALKALMEREQGKKQMFSIHSKDTIGNSRPDIILIDNKKLDHKLFSRYPGAKVILIDTGLGQEEIISIMADYKIHGLLQSHTNAQLFIKALKVVNEGELWLDNNTMRVLLHSERSPREPNASNGATAREKEIVRYVSLGYTNKEIASKLFLSEQTVKSHLNRIFKKFNVTSRSKLITLVLNPGKRGGAQPASS